VRGFPSTPPTVSLADNGVSVPRPPNLVWLRVQLSAPEVRPPGGNHALSSGEETAVLRRLLVDLTGQLLNLAEPLKELLRETLI
jgi:hypothetical protein